MIVHFLCNWWHWAWISTILWCPVPIFGCFNVRLVLQEHHLQPVQASISRPIQAQLSASSLKDAEFFLAFFYFTFSVKALKVWETKLVKVNQNIVFELILVCSFGSFYIIYTSYWFFFFIWDYFYVRCREIKGWEGEKMEAYFLLIISTWSLCEKIHTRLYYIFS